MTFSLVARCRDTGMFGVAVASSSPAVAARCAYARAGVGAVASQNVTDPTLGPRALDLMAARRDRRRGGRRSSAAPPPTRNTASSSPSTPPAASAIHSGPNALGTWAEALAPDVACGGNLLADARRPAGDGRRLRRGAPAISATGSSPPCAPPSMPAARPARSTPPG